jgi:hypothetical protein
MADSSAVPTSQFAGKRPSNVPAAALASWIERMGFSSAPRLTADSRQKFARGVIAAGLRRCLAAMGLFWAVAAGAAIELAAAIPDDMSVNMILSLT